MFDGILNVLVGFVGERFLDAKLLTILAAIVVWGFKKWIVPLLDTVLEQKLAQHIGNIADDLTDELVLKYPESEWARWADDLTDKLIEQIGKKKVRVWKSKPIGRGTAGRAICASLGRKKLNGGIKG